MSRHNYIGHNYISASPTAFLLRGYGRAGTQNDRHGEASACRRSAADTPVYAHARTHVRLAQAQLNHTHVYARPAHVLYTMGLPKRATEHTCLHRMYPKARSLYRRRVAGGGVHRAGRRRHRRVVALRLSTSASHRRRRRWRASRWLASASACRRSTPTH